MRFVVEKSLFYFEFIFDAEYIFDKESSISERKLSLFVTVSLDWNFEFTFIESNYIFIPFRFHSFSFIWLCVAWNLHIVVHINHQTHTIFTIWWKSHNQLFIHTFDGDNSYLKTATNRQNRKHQFELNFANENETFLLNFSILFSALTFAIVLKSWRKNGVDWIKSNWILKCIRSTAQRPSDSRK